MAKLATCPGCTTQLALPEDATLSDRARCPRCHEEFLLMETVQFSIPTAEILPHSEPETFSASETRSPIAYTPVPDPYAPADSEHDAPNCDSADEHEPASGLESTAEALPANATLSDWEARLKRAISGDLDEPVSAKQPSKPIFEFREQAPPETQPPEPTTYEPEDFAVADADLLPEAQTASAGRQGNWPTEHPYDEEEAPTVNLVGDQTVSGPYGGLPLDTSTPTIRTDVTPVRTQRRRSPLRTLASASLGVVGVPLGLYALLWLRGPAGDMLNIAQYLPSFILPAEFRQLDSDLGASRLAYQPIDQGRIDPAAEQIHADDVTPTEEIAEADPLIREDPAVAQASAELPAYQGPTFAPVDAAAFDQLLAAAQQAAPLLSEGDLETKESVASKGQAYMTVARLADKMSYLSQSLRTPADMARAEAAEDLITTTLSDDVVQRDVPQIALRWWQYADRPSPGIVFIGEVKRLQPTEAGTLAYVSLAGDVIMPDIPVLMGRADYKEGAVIGVAGTIESDLSNSAPWQDDDVGNAVIAHFSFPLSPTGAAQHNDR